jgi:hypothetical protein
VASSPSSAARAAAASCNAALALEPDRYCSPHHTLPLTSRNEGSKLA